MKNSSLSPADTVFLTRNEAAELLRQNVQNVDLLIRTERLAAYRPVGRRVLILRSDLLRLISESPLWKSGAR